LKFFIETINYSLLQEEKSHAENIKHKMGQAVYGGCRGSGRLVKLFSDGEAGGRGDCLK